MIAIYLFLWLFIYLFLYEQGGEHGAVLTVTVNDMGNYGCYPDCAEKISMPLFTEASINLIRRRPINSVVAHGKRLSNRYSLLDIGFQSLCKFSEIKAKPNFF